MNWFPACTPAELMAPASVPITALIPNDPQPGLMVPCYTFRDCPEPSRFRLGAYMSNPPGDYYIPVYSNSAFMMERFNRPVSALTPLTGP